MTNEAMLKLVNEGIQKDDYLTTLLRLKDELTENIRIEVNKSKGGKSSDLAIIKRITSETKVNDVFGKYHPFSFEGKEYKCFLEGHYVLCGQSDFGYKLADKPFDIAKIIISEQFTDSKVIQITVDKKDLKLFTKVNNRKDRKPYVINNEKIRIGVNPYFLLDALEFVDTDTIYITSPIAPIALRNDIKGTVALVLPVRLKDDNTNS